MPHIGLRGIYNRQICCTNDEPKCKVIWLRPTLVLH